MTLSAPKTCQLCHHLPLEKFEIPRQTVFWKCPECGLYQDGLCSTQEVVDDPEYHESYRHQMGRKVATARVRLSRIAGLCQAASPRLLDVGCGVGAVLTAARERGWEGVGAEISPVVVENCRRSGFPCELIRDGNLPFPDQSFDIVTSWSVIEHVPDVRAALAEWRRVLRPGGILALDTSTADYWKARVLGVRYRRFWPHGHTYTFTESTLTRFLNETGFAIRRRPFVGSLRSLTWQQSLYCVGYQIPYEMRQLLRLQKPFMVFAERIEAVEACQRKAHEKSGFAASGDEKLGAVRLGA